MSTLRSPVLLALFTTAAVVTMALVWFGVRSFHQEQALERQRRRERLESSADAVAAIIRGRLAETGERLSSWVSNPAAQPLLLPEATVFTVADGRMEVFPKGSLPFLPIAVAEATPPLTIRQVEAVEFRDALEEAARRYRELAASTNGDARAEALLRLGRTLRKQGNFSGALQAHQQLARMEGASAGGVAATLAALDGERLTYTAAGKPEDAARCAARLAAMVDKGVWPLPRQKAEFYRELAGERPKPRSWALSEALLSAWAGSGEAPSETPHPTQPSGLLLQQFGGEPVLTVWRSNGRRSAAMVCYANSYFRRGIAEEFAFQIADAEGKHLAGAETASAENVMRLLGDARNPWVLRLWQDAAGAGTAVPGETGLTSRLLAGMLLLAIVFLWGAVYFMARAIRREAQTARLQSDFVARVSHEFRSPLTTVRQLSEMLEMGQVPNEDRRQRYYQVLSTEARRLQRLVETTLHFGRMEEGAERYRKERLPVRELVERSVGESSHPQGASRIRVHPPATELFTLGDMDALALALRNLVENALKYSPETEAVDIRWTEDSGQVRIAVEDRGAGIPRDEQRRVFQKFVRGRAAVEANVQGTGIGLAMVRHIVQAHRGEIELSSEVGRGSTFTLVLPQA